MDDDELGGDGESREVVQRHAFAAEDGEHRTKIARGLAVVRPALVGAQDEKIGGRRGHAVAVAARGAGAGGGGGGGRGRRARRGGGGGGGGGWRGGATAAASSRVTSSASATTTSPGRS